MSNYNLDSPGERLKWARFNAGYQSATDFSASIGMKEVTYRAYENNQNGFARHAPLFAERLGVTSDWLIKGGDLPSLPLRPTVRSVLPEDNIFETILRAVLEQRAPGNWSDDLIKDLTRVVREAVEFLAKHQGMAADPQSVHALATGIALQLARRDEPQG